MIQINKRKPGTIYETLVLSLIPVRFNLESKY